MMLLGDNILKYRTIRQISATELSNRSGVKQSYISQIENNKKTPTLHVLTNIATALGVNVSTLIGEPFVQYTLTERQKTLLSMVIGMEDRYVEHLIHTAQLLTDSKKNTIFPELPHVNAPHLYLNEDSPTYKKEKE